MNIDIHETNVETVAHLSTLIPEFTGPHPAEEYRQRMQGKTSLLLAAYADGALAGFKVGYDKFGDGSFYSWMGGVLPAYRKHHIAKALADRQEAWAKEHGFDSIIFKTRNRHKAMLMFAIANGFSIIDVTPAASLAEYRILLKKFLSRPTTE
jgi:ribosomal protein S18 acetylase RimI-like enzyme